MLTLTQVWGALLIFVVCPLLGALPLPGLVLRPGLRGRSPTASAGPIGVSTVFEQGGAIAGILAILLEGAKGIASVLLARHYFPTDPAWEILALIALVMGRYWASHTVGTTSVLWGALVHSPVIAGLTLLIGFLGFTIFRERQQGRLLVLVLFPLITALSQPNGVRIVLAVCLSGLIAWIYEKTPEDLEWPAAATRLESKRLFAFFRSDRALLSLEKRLDAQTAGSKAARLSQLIAWGYPVPRGYVLPAGDDPAMLLEITRPSAAQPLVVRPSVVGDYPAIAASAGQYTALTDITSQEALYAAMNQCFRSYNSASAEQYRRDRDLPEGSLAVLVQQQISAVYSGVAFSRDPFTCRGDTVLIEAAAGAASRIINGKHLPARFQVNIQTNDLGNLDHPNTDWRIPAALTLQISGLGEVPHRLLEEIAFLARHVEARFSNIPQNIEWSFDGDRLWLLQSRPIIPPASPPQPAPTAALPGDTAHPHPPSPAPLSGIPISPGTAIGPVVVLQSQKDPATLPTDAILVVPYLKASEIPAIAHAGITGLIAETGGQLSNGAITTREYGLPTVILPRRRDRLKAHQRIRLDGQTGAIDLLQ